MANIVIVIKMPGRKVNDDLVEDVAGELWESLDANLLGSTTARVEVLAPLLFADGERIEVSQ